MKWKLGMCIAASLAALLVAKQASAAADLTLNADLITSNSALGPQIESQLSVEVMDVGTGAQFTFINAGPLASSITDVYWGGPGPSPLNFSMVTLPTNWTAGAAPPGLPGANTFAVLYSADSDSPVQPNGVQVNESIVFTIAYASGSNLASLINALNGGQLQVGFHVQGLSDGESESYLTTPGEMVPVPAPLGLAAVGFALVALRRRKTSSKA
ncbi:MAG: hypothetical protein WD873_05240 [Candidatus Hydrogenedentales bacterium]